MGIDCQNDPVTTRQSSTLSKGLSLLQALVLDQGRSNLTAIALREAIPLATAHRLAATLEAGGYIERQAKGCFVAGEALQMLAQDCHVGAPRVAARLRQPLERIARHHNVVLHFGILEEGMVTYLLKTGRASGALFTAEGLQLEAYCSAIGKVLLAALPDDQLDAYLGGGPFVALTSNTITEPRALRSEMAAVRIAGMAHDRFEVHEDLYCFAIPVRDAAGIVVGGMSASFMGRVPSGNELAPLARAMKRLALPVIARKRH